MREVRVRDGPRPRKFERVDFQLKMLKSELDSTRHDSALLNQLAVDANMYVTNKCDKVYDKHSLEDKVGNDMREKAQICVIRILVTHVSVSLKVCVPVVVHAKALL